ncbi:MAG: hypothetical protein RL088_2777 [Verrucomicrobiota bacterium]|jgi:ABC-type cobalt transport system substrate-binding protein
MIVFSQARYEPPNAEIAAILLAIVFAIGCIKSYFFQRRFRRDKKKNDPEEK